MTSTARRLCAVGLCGLLANAGGCGIKQRHSHPSEPAGTPAAVSADQVKEGDALPRVTLPETPAKPPVAASPTPADAATDAAGDARDSSDATGAAAEDTASDTEGDSSDELADVCHATDAELREHGLAAEPDGGGEEQPVVRCELGGGAGAIEAVLPAAIEQARASACAAGGTLSESAFYALLESHCVTVGGETDGGDGAVDGAGGAADAADAADATDPTDAADATDATDATDGAADATDATDGGVDATGATDATDGGTGAADATDGAADASAGATGAGDGGAVDPGDDAHSGGGKGHHPHDHHHHNPKFKGDHQ